MLIHLGIDVLVFVIALQLTDSLRQLLLAFLFIHKLVFSDDLTLRTEHACGLGLVVRILLVFWLLSGAVQGRNRRRLFHS